MDKSDQVKALNLIVCLLPKPNADLLNVLLRFLIEVSTYSGNDALSEVGNKMDISNLAVIIAPNILFNKAKTQEQNSEIIYVVKLLLENGASIFRVSFILTKIPDAVVNYLNTLDRPGHS